MSSSLVYIFISAFATKKLLIIFSFYTIFIRILSNSASQIIENICPPFFYFLSFYISPKFGQTINETLNISATINLNIRYQ